MLMALFVVDGDKLVLLKSSYDLSDYNFLTRSRIKDALKTFALQISQNLETKALQEIIHEMNGVIYRYFAKLVGNVICLSVIKEYYPPDLMDSVLDKCPNNNLDDLLKEYKDYKKHDYIELISKEVAETRVVLTRTLDAVVNRGESLSGLSENAEKLEVKSRALFQKVKKQNKRCC